jgi:maltose alpha-D-glucosyltransferase / alpha-amylase
VAMQWTAGPNAGFTTGEPAVPLVTDGPFGPDRVNVATQRRDPESLLNWMERAIRARKELPELGWGAWRVLDTDQPAVLAHRCDWQGQGVLVLHNLGPERVKVGVELGDDVEAGRPMAELLGNRHHQPATTGQPLDLDRFGYRWLRLPG